jgi:voltage-gated potassium channel
MGADRRDRTSGAGFLLWLQNQDAALSFFLVLLVTSTLLSWPLHDLLPHWVFDGLVIATVLFGVAVLAPSPRIAVLGGVIGLAVTAQRLSGIGRLSILETGPALAFFALLAAALFARVFRPGEITVHRLLGAVALFVVLAVTWGLAFQTVQGVRPDAIMAGDRPANAQEIMWLSFVTLTTVGYGDVLPVGPMAKTLAALEALTGVLYPSVLIGFLVSQAAASRPAKGR